MKRKPGMDTLYFNCGSGVSGDMITGALLDLGIDGRYLITQLTKLGLDGYAIRIEKVDKRGVPATRFIVDAREEKEPRSLADILDLIDSSTLSACVKKMSGEIFRELARAESIVHETPIEQVHFHEVGAIDSIIDVVSAAILLHRLDPKEIYCGSIADGFGVTETAHGPMDIPVPAVRLLLRDAPTTRAEVNAELTTPTGAAIMKSIVTGYRSEIPEGKAGYGAGSMDLERPNVLEAVLTE